MFDLLSVFFAFVLLGLLILVARFVKHHVGLFQTLYLPESIIAGAIALLLGPAVFGAIATSLGVDSESYLAGGIFRNPFAPFGLNVREYLLTLSLRRYFSENSFLTRETSGVKHLLKLPLVKPLPGDSMCSVCC